MASGGIFLAKRLADAIVHHDLTWKELAKRAGVSAPYISNLQRGRVKWPDPEILVRLAEVLRVPLSYFIRGMDGWHWASHLNNPESAKLFDFMKPAKVLYSVSSNMTSFLVPRPLEKLLWEDLNQKAYPDPEQYERRLKIETAYSVSRRKSRNSDGFRLKIICPGAAFNRAAEAGQREWIEHMADEVDKHHDNTALGLVEDHRWHHVQEMLYGHIPDVDWFKINVADNKLAIVYTPHDTFYSFDRKIVENLRTVTDDTNGGCASVIQYTFPSIVRGSERADIYDRARDGALNAIKDRWPACRPASPVAGQKPPSSRMGETS